MKVYVLGKRNGKMYVCHMPLSAVRGTFEDCVELDRANYLRQIADGTPVLAL